MEYRGKSLIIMPFSRQKYGLEGELMSPIHDLHHSSRALAWLVHSPNGIDEGEHGIPADGIGSDFLDIIDISRAGDTAVFIQGVENGEFDLSPVIR